MGDLNLFLILPCLWRHVDQPGGDVLRDSCSILFSRRKESTHPTPTGPVICRMANRRTVFSTQPHSRCLPWYNLYKRQIEFIAMSLAQQPEPWG